jgi:hypothetical protein
MFLLVDRILVERYVHIESYYNTFYNMHAILVSLSLFSGMCSHSNGRPLIVLFRREEGCGEGEFLTSTVLP